MTRQCLDRILTGPPERAEFEIVVVDDGSDDDTPELLGAREDLVRVVRHERNLGFARSCNAGAALADCPYLVFLNNDTVPEPGWLDALVAYADAVPEAAMVGSKLLYPNDTVQHAGIVVTQEGVPRHIYAGFPADHPAVSKSRPFQMVTGACVLVRRDAFEAASGFDELFVNGYEDLDLCLRLREEGMEIHLCAESVLYHFEKATRDERTYRRNHELFLHRWGPRLRADDLHYYIEDGLLQMTYWEHYPIRLEVSPLLAEVEQESRAADTDRLLAFRARQAFELLQENLALRLGPRPGDDGAERDSSNGGPRRSDHAAVLFLSGAPGDTKRYRCDHQAEQLRLLGATADIAMVDEIPLGEVIDRYECFVLHRVAWDEHVGWLLNELRRHGKATIFDGDDLVFDPRATSHIAALGDMTASERRLFEQGLLRFRRTMLACDAVVVTTEALRAEAAEIHPKVVVAPNAVSTEMVELAEQALSRRDDRPQGERKGLRVAYLSGTHTHNRDFIEAADAVLDLIATDPNATFLAVGHLRLDRRFDRFADQVERIALQPWQRLPALLAGVDINLAPLEPDNRFTEAKSCLKYLEAGLVAVPTIASPRSDFVRAIRPGDNGLLADNPAEWRDALNVLAESPELRSEIGCRAYDDVRANHTTKALASAYYDKIGSLARERGQATPSSLTANWISRAPIAQTGGGYRNIFRLARHLGESGHRVRMYVEPNDHLAGLSHAEIVGFLEENFGPIKFDVVVGHENIAPADVTIATNWPTAYTVAEHRASLFRVYLIQDFEPDFYSREDPRSDQADRTYDLPLRHICLGRNLAERISTQTGKPAEHIDFGLDPAFALTRAPAERKDPVSILFFARPGLKRRGYEIGLQALRELKRDRPDARVIFFGATTEELGDIDFDHENLGVLDASALAHAMNEAHILLTFSLTNISYVPFEGMACGCAVVEADVPWMEHMVDPGKNCLLAKVDAHEVARTLERLINDPELRVSLAEHAARSMRGHTSAEVARRFEEILLEGRFVQLDPKRVEAHAEASTASG